jgi:hypothetical protein
MRTGALEVVGGQVTAPSTTFTALTVNTGNTLTVRNSPRGAYLLDVWGNFQGTAGIVRITSPRLHDNVNGIYLRPKAATVVPLKSRYAQALVSQDTLAIEAQGSATGGDIEIVGFNWYYPDLPGSNGTFLHPGELATWGTGQIMAFENTISTGTAGGWSGAEAVNAEQDQFKANRWYAILGYVVQVASGNKPGSIQYISPDFGNLGVGGPGDDTYKIETRNYFVNLSAEYGVPLIPCFNAANKGATTIAAHQDENGADPIVNTICALLKSEFDPNLLT